VKLARACAYFVLCMLSALPARAAGSTSLVREAFWADRNDATLVDGVLRIDGTGEERVEPNGARLVVDGDFRVIATLQASTDGVAALVLEDETGAALEFGLAQGEVVLNDAAFAVDAPLGPVTLELTRSGGTLRLAVSGAPVAESAYPFAGRRLSLGTHVAAGNQLSVYALDVDGTVGVDRCAPDVLLVAGSETFDGPSAMWWLAPDASQMRRIDTDGQRAYLVAVSPDRRWLTYYERSPQAPPDRFVVDTWVMNLVTEERHKLVEAATPFAWAADSRGVVLGERPTVTAVVPGGMEVPTDGPIIQADSLRGSTSPNGVLRALVSSTPNGAGGIEFLDRASGDLLLEVPTGRGAVQLAWAPDSMRVAYANGVDSRDGLSWRLRMVDLTSRSVGLLEPTRDMEIHSVVWVPTLPGCSPG
jgi:hypothetical protein